MTETEKDMALIAFTRYHSVIFPCINLVLPLLDWGTVVGQTQSMARLQKIWNSDGLGRRAASRGLLFGSFMPQDVPHTPQLLLNCKRGNVC